MNQTVIQTLDVCRKQIYLSCSLLGIQFLEVLPEVNILECFNSLIAF